MCLLMLVTPKFLILKATLAWFIEQLMHHLHAVPQVLFEVIEYIFLWSIKQSFKFVHMRKLFMMNLRVTIQIWIASKNQGQNFPTALQVRKTSYLFFLYCSYLLFIRYFSCVTFQVFYEQKWLLFSLSTYPFFTYRENTSRGR